MFALFMRASVIIPAHNEEKYIGRTLRSVSSPDVEVIVVCNGCTDDTEIIARRFVDKVYVLGEANVSKARNFGASKARAGRLIFLDADILVAPNTMQRIVSSHYNVGTSLVRADSKNLLYRLMMFGKGYAHWFGCCTGLIFCDRELFNKVGGFDESLFSGEDGKLLRTAKRVGKYGVVNGCVYNNMRRYERLGLVNVCWFWIRHYLFGVRKVQEVIR